AQLEKPAAVGEEKGFNPIYAAVLLSLFVITAILFYFVLFAGKHNKSNKKPPILKNKGNSSSIKMQSSPKEKIHAITQELYSMSPDRFETLAKANDLPKYIASAIQRPEVENVLSFADSKDDLYLVLYNLCIIDHHPDKKPVFRLDKNILQYPLAKNGNIPLYLSENFPIYSLEQLFRFLPALSEDEFEQFINRDRHMLSTWAMQFGYEFSLLFARASTKDHFDSILRQVKQEQTLYSYYINRKF
ncbi:MAG: hypothetical protein KKF44_00590, partial [Nanoarchaeota archaeon]|nr:hypothetical protein [Nanoarchaeota archaeon]